MKHQYSLVHLSDINCSPPDFIRAAAAAGYDAVSLRTIPMGLKGEHPHNIAADRNLFHLCWDFRRGIAEMNIVKAAFRGCPHLLQGDPGSVIVEKIQHNTRVRGFDRFFL